MPYVDRSSADSVWAVPVIPASFSYLRKKFWSVIVANVCTSALMGSPSLRLERLVEALAEAAALKDAARVLVDDVELAALDHVVAVTLRRVPSP